MSIKIKLTPREWILVGIVSVCIAGYFCVRGIFIMEKKENNHLEIKTLVEERKDYIQKIEKLIRNDFDYLEKIYAPVDERKLIPEVLGDVDRMIQKNKLSLIDVKTSQKKLGELFIFDIELILEGRGLEINSFVQFFQKSPKFFLLKKIEMERVHNFKMEALQSKILLRKILLSQRIQQKMRKILDWGETQNYKKEKKESFFFSQDKEETRPLVKNIFTTVKEENTRNKDEPRHVENFYLQHQIIGVVLDPQPQIALQNNQTKEVVFLSKGEALDGFILKDILEDKAVFFNQEKKVDLEIK